MSLSRVVLAALAVLCLLVVPSAAQTCNGPAVSVGPPIVPAYQYIYTPSALTGSLRTLSVQTQVSQLQMFVYWGNGTNTVPVNLSLALYAFQPCNGLGEAVLLRQSAVTTYAVQTLSQNTGYYITLSLTSPIIVPAGRYYVSMDTSSQYLLPLFGNVTGATGVLYDFYGANTYNLAAPINFPATSLFLAAYGGYDTEATIIGTQCVSSEPVASFPTCNARLADSYPAGYGANYLPCPASQQVIGGSEYDPSYVSAVNLATDVVRLIPSTITQTQTLYAVSFTTLPGSNTTQNYTLRPAVYSMTAGTTTFTLLAQANQTNVPGYVLANNVVELWFPIYPPINVTAGQVIYINRLVDQAGLQLIFSGTGGTYTAATAITTAQSAPTTLTTTGSGGVDASHATLGCALGQPPVSSSAAPFVSSSASVSSSARASSSAASSSTAAAGVSSSSAAVVPAGGVSSSSATVVVVASSSAVVPATGVSAVSALPASSLPVAAGVSSSSAPSNPPSGGNAASTQAASGVVSMVVALFAVVALLL